jgi:hypothetical protein
MNQKEKNDILFKKLQFVAIVITSIALVISSILEK